MLRNRMALIAATVPLLVIASVSLCKAQSQPLQFDIVSIKLRSGGMGLSFKPWVPGFQCDPTQQCGVNGNRFREVSVSLADLIMDAYKVRKYQIVGLPDWGDSGQDFYDLEATTKDDFIPTDDEARQMLQSILAGRFQLRFHRETREHPVYALVAEKKGVRVVPNPSRCGAAGEKRAADPSNQARDYQFPWAFFVGILSNRTDRPIMDETGLDGTGYCTVDGQNPTLAVLNEIYNGASVFAAVEDAWGMKLEPRNAQVEVLVIESVMRPSAN